MKLSGLGAKGVTLVELLVVLAILGVMAGVVGLAFATGSGVRDDRTEAATTVLRARTEALRSGATVQATVFVEGTPHAIAVLPDGRVLADSALGVDTFTGAVR